MNLLFVCLLVGWLVCWFVCLFVCACFLCLFGCLKAFLDSRRQRSLPNPVRENNNEIGAILFTCVSKGQMQAYISYMYVNMYFLYCKKKYIYIYMSIFYNYPLSCTHTHILCQVFSRHHSRWGCRCRWDRQGHRGPDRPMWNNIAGKDEDMRGFLEVHWDSLRFIEVHLDSLRFIEVHWDSWTFPTISGFSSWVKSFDDLTPVFCGFFETFHDVWGLG